MPARIRYLAEADVARVAPPPATWIELGRRILTSLAGGDVQLPPKTTVRPRPDAFANAMPAYVPDAELLGVKWVDVHRGNDRQGLPTVTGAILLADASTGLLRGVLGAAWLTGARTAGVSGACMAALAPTEPGHLAVTGAGVQARTHLQVAHALGHPEAAVWARRSEAGEELVRWAAEHTPDLHVRLASSAAAAVEGAAIVVTAVAIGVDGLRLEPSAVRPDALLLPLDYATSVGGDLAEGAVLTSDDPGQFERFRADGSFPGYREADLASGALLSGPRPAGRIVCQNLGNGAADLVFADAVLAAAERAGVGALLPR